MEAKPSDADLKAKVTGVLVKLKELEVSSEWEQIASKPCKMYKMGIDSRVASKGIAVVNFPISKII